jgi:glycosyltransferase involved in cell wall biosynthesis
MVGWGPEEASLRAQAPANLEIVGFLRGAPLREALGRARIFLLPTRAETLGLAVVEAMASGCAVISTAPVEFEGVRITPGDREGVIGAVKRLWEDREATRTMGATNVTIAPRYSWDRYFERLVEAYRQVLEESGASSTVK